MTSLGKAGPDERFSRALAAVAIVFGTAAALFYARAGLTLSHYDAKAHLVVARRVLDSLTPGWAQVGAVWLPLPHLLNLFPVQVDAFYRSGASAVAISVLSFGITCYAAARLVLQATGSRAGAMIACALVALDPNVLYLQATPMTEPLLFGLTLLAISLVVDWVETDARRPPRAAGATIALACLTRYEAWFVTAALVSLAGLALWRKGLPARRIFLPIARLALYPAAAIVAFMFQSRFTVGAWLVTGGFFIPDNAARGNLFRAVGQAVWGVIQLKGVVFTLLGGAGVVAAAYDATRGPRRASTLVTLSLAAFLVLPSYAFFEGHPFRMRYLIAPAVAASVFCGIAIGMVRGSRRAVAAAAVAIALALSVKPFDAHAPMVLEAQSDRSLRLGRRTVTACLMRDFRGEPILMSMGSLAHYMHELSQEGLYIRNFIHEGNHPYWDEAVVAPKGRAGWILMEEQSEGGDVLAARVREAPALLEGFHRVCEGGGVALYRAGGPSLAGDRVLRP